ncbi:MAG: DUF448 domain-containing protein [Actinomycetota bacterium]|nr:DUF448 domain-containing protein [Actinomycetota bacterium]
MAEGGSVRTCVVCRDRAAPAEMVRLRFDGPVLSASARNGRGYWVHRDSPECLDPAAIAKAVSFRRRKVVPEMVQLP